MTDLTEEELRMIRYLDGELAPAQAAAFEADMARDPALAAKVARWRAQARALQGALAGTLDEPVPDRLLAAATVPKPAEVVPLRLGRAPRWAGPGLAMAASLLLGLSIGLWSQPANQAPFRLGPDGALLAQGALDQALTSAASGESVDGVRVVLTIPAPDDAHCRLFEAQGQSGLACGAGSGQSGGEWRVVALAEQPAAVSGAYQLASGPPEAILSALEAQRTGDPLDRDAERALIEAAWR